MNRVPPWKSGVKRRRLILVAALLFSCGVYAGPNDGVVLTVHGNQGADPHGDPCGAIFIPETCEELLSTAEPDSWGWEWFLVIAARSDDLEFHTIAFGLGDYDPYNCYLAYYGACFQWAGPLELPSGGWPEPMSGMRVSWRPECLVGTLVPVYYFGFYVYYGGGPVPLGAHPELMAGVGSCEDDFEIDDPFLALGTMGVGDAEGEVVCPPPLGACCYPDGICRLRTREGCLADGQVWVGGPCQPNPCEQPGACCLSDGTCVLLPPSLCVAEGGEFYGGDCEPNPCPTGACCFDIFCVMMTEADCNQQGGIWKGGSCWPNPCQTSGVAVQKTSWGRVKSLYR